MPGCSEPRCDGKHTARGLCHRHYRMFLRQGGERKLVLTRHYGKTPEQRFWLYVKRGRRCWEWTGYKNAKGYGVINLGGERMLAHRMAYQMAHGALPKPPLFVLHSCDNPACCRDSHLFVGTKAMNNLDMTMKGRRRDTGAPGIKNGFAKLDEAAVRAIRSTPEFGPVLAARYGVTVSTISFIISRKTWKHLA